MLRMKVYERICSWVSWPNVKLIFCQSRNIYKLSRCSPLFTSHSTSLCQTFSFCMDVPQSVFKIKMSLVSTADISNVPLFVCKYISIIKMLVSVFVLLEFYKSIWPAPGVPTITYGISQECTRWVSLQNHKPLTRRPKRTPSSSVCLTSSLWLRCLSVLVERERGF